MHKDKDTRTHWNTSKSTIRHHERFAVFCGAFWIEGDLEPRCAVYSHGTLVIDRVLIVMLGFDRDLCDVCRLGLLQPLLHLLVLRLSQLSLLFILCV